MQLAGTTCGICKQTIPFADEGTWCGRCQTPLHRDCLEGAESQCPACRESYDSPERHFAYARQCPECWRPMAAPALRCPSCAGIAHWDTLAQYQQRVEQMHSEGQLYLFIGIAELLLAAVLFYLSMALLFLVLVAFGLIFVALWLLGDGVNRLRLSRHMRQWQ